MKREWFIDTENLYKDEEYISCVLDLLKSAPVQSMRNYIQHGSTSTLEHCLRVSYISYKIAKKLSLDEKSTARAGLLHDLFLYDWHKNTEKKPFLKKHGFTHPHRALLNAQEYFNLNDVEVDIIEKHMWPLTITKMPRYRESYIVTSVDKFCSTIETFEPFLSKLKHSNVKSEKNI